jgi:hypothetical protein
MDSLDWSKTYPVLTISRLFLRNVCRIPSEVINTLTEADMFAIADSLHEHYADHFHEWVGFVVMLYMVERTTGEQDAKN